MSNFLISLIAHNGKYVCAEGGGGGSLAANRDEIGPWETFRLIHLSDRLDSRDTALVALQTHDGHYVRAEDGNGSLVVIANGNTIGDRETFKITNVGNKNGISQFDLVLLACEGGHVCPDDGGGSHLVTSQRSGYRSIDVFTGIVKDNLPGLNFLDRLFLKRIQDKHQQTKRVGSLGRKLDELLAFKTEMVEKIENTVMFIEQNCFDRRLENSILFLAGYGSDERSRDDMSFNGSDSRFGHDLARRLQRDENLTVKQAGTALDMMQKYSKTQLEPNGYSLPTEWEEISHQYREPKIETDRPVMVVLKTGESFILTTGENCNAYITISCSDESLYQSIREDYEEDVWNWGVGYGMRESGIINILIKDTEPLMNRIADCIESGYDGYVDPDIEVAYYLWQQEQERDR